LRECPREDSVEKFPSCCRGLPPGTGSSQIRLRRQDGAFNYPSFMHGNISPTMFTGSMVGSGAMAFALMSYCVANARPDENDCLDLNPPLLAAVFGESVSTIETAISFLCSEDLKSRSPDEGGKRIILVGPGPFRYRVVNLSKYRSDQDREYRTEYWRQHKQWQRDGRKGVFKFNPMSTPCPQVSNPVHPAVAGTDAVILKEGRSGLPTLDQVKTRAQFIGMPESDAVAFWNHFESTGWIDKNGHQIVRWESKQDNWKVTARVQQFERNSQHRNGSPRPLDIKTIIEAKQSLANDLRGKFSSDVAMGTVWNNEQKQTEYIGLCKEIKTLKTQLSKMA